MFKKITAHPKYLAVLLLVLIVAMPFYFAEKLLFYTADKVNDMADMWKHSTSLKKFANFLKQLVAKYRPD